MSPITHAAVENLVKNLPQEKLADAYRFLSVLTSDGNGETSLQNFMHLPLSERRRLMSAQAQEAAELYERSAVDRDAWQSGDFRDE